MNLDKLKASLKQHEGVRHQPYTCTAGALTIGCGRNLDAKGLSAREIDFLLDNDIADAVFDLDREHHGWRCHTSNRQNVLVEMMFAMGAPTFGKFVRLRAALERRDYDAAAAEILDSKWARQVGQRAMTLAEQMRNG